MPIGSLDAYPPDLVIDQHDEMVASLKNLYENPKLSELSDLTIVTKTREYRVHKAVLCGRSEFFEKACLIGFIESESGVINLENDDPKALDSMIEYLYCYDYKDPVDNAEQDSDTNDAESSQDSEKVTEWIAEVTLDLDEGVQSVVPWKWEVRNPSQSRWLPKTYFAHHAKVYALADFFCLPGLKSYAKWKFEQERHSLVHGTVKDFGKAVEIAYEMTPDTDRGLRDLIVDIFAEKLSVVWFDIEMQKVMSKKKSSLFNSDFLLRKLPETLEM